MDPKILLFSAIFAAVTGQLLMKTGLNQLGALTDINLAVFFRMVFNPYVFGGIASYGIGFIAYLFALSRLDQSFAYPMFALGYVLVPLYNWIVMHEPFSVARLVGILLVLVGVSLISR
ncbi:MAG: EamA family transporter [Chloroflexi bacterium]|nr:EamA family transporter [Chloroflexota bacterium]